MLVLSCQIEIIHQDLHLLALQLVFMCFFQGEAIGSLEATEAFFAMTKLFQSKDVSFF